MTETEIEKRGGGVVLSDSPALHSSLTVSPVFILFVGGGEARCSAFTHTRHAHTQWQDNIQTQTHIHRYTHSTETAMTRFHRHIHHAQRYLIH